MSLNRLALLHDRGGRYAEAEPLYRRALAILESALSPEHASVAQSLDNLALLYDEQGRYAKAEPLYKRALTAWGQTLGPTHPKLATTLENYAALLRKVNRASEAAELEARAKAIPAQRPPRAPGDDCRTLVSRAGSGSDRPDGWAAAMPAVQTRAM